MKYAGRWKSEKSPRGRTGLAESGLLEQILDLGVS